MQGTVIRRRRTGSSRRWFAFLAGLVLTAASLSTASSAVAEGNSGPGSTADCSKTLPGQAVCTSAVYFTGNGSTAVKTGTLSDPSLPGCWYEPSFFTPTILSDAYLVPFLNLLAVFLTDGDTGTNFNFHSGEKGRWWGFVFNPGMSSADALAHCQLTGWPMLEWVPDTAPPAQDDVSTLKMAAAARNEISLTPPTLTLRPGANNQVVNLATLVSFATGFPRTSVTAHLNVDGYTLAATTIATPASITVDAGTSNASPSSCTYTLASSGGSDPTYQVDPNSTRCSDGSSGPNAGIVYRRPTAAGTTYPLTATVTWNVTWNDTDSADSPPQPGQTLPPLTLTTPPTPVAVNEVETVNHQP